MRAAYAAVLDAIKLTVKLKIAEIKQLAGHWVLARTHSVKVTVKSQRNWRRRS